MEESGPDSMKQQGSDSSGTGVGPVLGSEGGTIGSNLMEAPGNKHGGNDNCVM